MYIHMYLRHNVHTFVRVEKFQSVEMKCVIEFDRKLLGRKIIVYANILYNHRVCLQVCRTLYNFAIFRAWKQSYLRCWAQDAEPDYKKFSSTVHFVNGERTLVPEHGNSPGWNLLPLSLFHASRTKLTESGKLVDTFCYYVVAPTTTLRLRWKALAVRLFE